MPPVLHFGGLRFAGFAWLSRFTFQYEGVLHVFREGYLFHVAYMSINVCGSEHQKSSHLMGRL